METHPSSHTILDLLSLVGDLSSGYHWDCSDWALVNDGQHQSRPTHLLEVSAQEVRDSESNSDNSQIELTGEDVRRLSITGLNSRRKGFVGSSSSSLETSVTETNPSSEIRRLARECTSNGVREEDEEDVDTVHESSGLLGLEDIEFADRSPSDKYVSHPNSYLPIYQTIGADIEGSEGGMSCDQNWTSTGDVHSCKTKSDISSTDNICITSANTALLNVNHNHLDLKNNKNENGYEGASEGGSSPATNTGSDIESTYV